MKTNILLITLLMLFSCQQKQKSTAKTDSNQTATADKVELTQPPVYLDTLKTSDEIIRHISKRTEEIKTLLDDAQSLQANGLYENFRKENDSAMVLLMRKNEKLLENFYSYYDYEAETWTRTIPDSLKNYVANIESRGIEFWDVGEAMTDFRMNPDYYYKLFNGKLSPDYQRYLNIITEEDKTLFYSDASITVSWKDVAERVLVREDFLQKFPKSKLDETVRRELAHYRYAYLLGADNTKTFEYGYEGSPLLAFNSENLKEFKRFTREHPKSETTKMIREMLAKKFAPNEIYEWAQKRTGFSWHDY